MKERIHYIDVAKGLLIILVILHHFPQLMDQYGVSNPFLQFLDSASDYYNAFFMPTFFIITGYCTNILVSDCFVLVKAILKMWECLLQYLEKISQRCCHLSTSFI